MPNITLTQDIFDSVMEDKPIIGKCFLNPSADQINNSREKFCFPYKDKIFLLIDESMFTNGKSGIAITTSGVYGNELFCDFHGFDWEHIIHTNNIHIYDGKFCIDVFNISLSMSKFPLQELVDIVEEIACLLKEKYKIKTFSESQDEERDQKRNKDEYDEYDEYENDNEESKEINNEPSKKNKYILTDKIFNKAINKISTIGMDLTPSEKKIQNAKDKYGIPYNDKIYCLIDETVFGSAKEGLAITSSGVYWHASLDFDNECPKNGLKWNRFLDKDIEINGKKFKIMGFVFRKNVSDVNLFSLKELICKIDDLICENIVEKQKNTKNTRLSIETRNKYTIDDAIKLITNNDFFKKLLSNYTDSKENIEENDEEFDIDKELFENFKTTDMAILLSGTSDMAVVRESYKQYIINTSIFLEVLLGFSDLFYIRYFIKDENKYINSILTNEVAVFNLLIFYMFKTKATMGTAKNQEQFAIALLINSMCVGIINAYIENNYEDVDDNEFIEWAKNQENIINNNPELFAINFFTNICKQTSSVINNIKDDKYGGKLYSFFKKETKLSENTLIELFNDITKTIIENYHDKIHSN